MTKISQDEVKQLAINFKTSAFHSPMRPNPNAPCLYKVTDAKWCCVSCLLQFWAELIQLTVIMLYLELAV